MTKTLTEQWREGTLPQGYYYIIANTKARNKVIFYLPENTHTDGAVIKGEVVNGEDGGWVVEVLAPVPSYDEYKRLQERLADADKTIDYYDKKDFHYTLADGTVMGAEPAHKYKLKWGVK